MSPILNEAGCRILTFTGDHRHLVLGGKQSNQIQVGIVSAPVDKDGFFKLPPILKPTTEETASRFEDEPDSTTDSDVVRISDDDLWLESHDDFNKAPRLKTWDDFNHDDHTATPAAFITEAGPVAFDLLISRGKGEESSSHIADAATYSACLLALALGRNSLLFSWDPEKRSFVKTASHLRASGLSLQVTQDIDKLCLECANATKQLKSFAEKTYSAASTPTRVALAGAIDQLVLAVHSEINYRGHGSMSILQLQAVILPAHTVLTYFRNLVEKLAHQRTDEGILSCLFHEAQSAEYRSSLLLEVGRETLRLVSKPWTEFVEEWVGLRAEESSAITKQGPGKGFVKVAIKAWVDNLGYDMEETDYFLDEGKMPSFVPEGIARTTFEAGRNLRFLRENHPDHPLSKQNTVSRQNPPRLEWQFDWDAMTQLEEKVEKYKNALLGAVHDTPQAAGWEAVPVDSSRENHGMYGLGLFGQNNARIENNLLASMNRFNQPLKSHQEQTGLYALLRTHLDPTKRNCDGERLSPHWSLVPLLSFGPVIEAQSRIINQECMKVLFRSHHLRMHINLLKQYYLLDNGLLCSRLSHALFDPELETAERKAGVALGGGTMGLRLGGRENWPPASSELRLALMGVLSECYEAPSDFAGIVGASITSRSFNSDLPGDLSFAVRDLSPEEIDRCMDPDSLEALDFLRLSYNAPTPLRAVIAPSILVKFDLIFMTLLRVLRMLYVVDQLFMSIRLGDRHGPEPSDASLRFCIEARHFVHQIAAYFFNTGVKTPWRRFESWLDEVEKEALGEDAGKRNHSPDVLRERQEQVLDEIMLVLLLRKRHAPVLKLLNEAFALVLRFAKTMRMNDGEMTGERVRELYETFRKKVEVFLPVCKGLGEKTGGGPKVQRGEEGRRRVGENPLDQLLLRMDMAGFYVKKQAV